MHLLNHVWPNIFENSPHVVQAVTGAINGCRLALGPGIILSYVLQVCSLLVCDCNTTCVARLHGLVCVSIISLSYLLFQLCLHNEQLSPGMGTDTQLPIFAGC